MDFRKRGLFPTGEVQAGQAAFGFLLAYSALAVLGHILLGLGTFDSLVFLGCVVLAFYVPGSLLLSIAAVPVGGPLAHAVLATSVGSVVLPLFYRAVREFDLEFAFVWGILVLLAAAWSLRRLRKLRTGERGELVAWPDLIALACMLLTTVVLLHFSHFADVRFVDGGFLINASHMTESVYHLGIVNALADVFPPPALYASGSENFSYYHLSMHLQIELIGRMSGIDTLRLTTFYFPLLYFWLLSSLPFVFVRYLGGSAALAAICGVIVYCADWSYVPGLVLSNEVTPWTLYFATTIWSLFTLNGYLPATIALFTCLVLLWRYLDSQRMAWLVLYAACVIGSFGFKSSLGLQLAAATAGTGALWLLHDRQDRRGWYVLLAGLGLSTVLFVWGWKIGSASEAIAVRLAPFALLHGTLERLGLSWLDGTWYPLVIGLILMGGLGVRALGLWAGLQFVSTRGALGQLSLLVLVFFVGGYILSEVLILGRPGGQNDSIWFYVQSLMGAWFLLFAFLSRCRQSSHKVIWLSVLLIVLAAPSTLQFLDHRSEPEYRLIGPDEVSVIEFLRSVDPQSVVLHPLNRDRPSLASNFAGKPSVLNAFRSFVVEQDGLSERAADTATFFDPDASRDQRIEVLQKYGVDYVYMPMDLRQSLPVLPGMSLELELTSVAVYRVVNNVLLNGRGLE